jgi:pimeloyl-ACP methyl ester carboxylesterase
VLTPELHRGSLAGDTAAVQAAVDELGGSAVVCGWSYGGAVITGLELGAGSHLVYVAAFVLDDGESVMDLAMSVPSLLGTGIVPQDDGTAIIDPEIIDAALWADAPAEVAAAAREKLRPQAFAVMGETQPRQAWKSIQSTYVLCSKDEALAPEVQRRLAARTGEVVEWDASHSPMLSRPADMVAVLDKLAS